MPIIETSHRLDIPHSIMRRDYYERRCIVSGQAMLNKRQKEMYNRLVEQGISRMDALKRVNLEELA